MEFQEKRPEISQISAELQKFFNEERLKDLAGEAGFIKQERKLTAISFVKMCIRSVVNKGHSSSLTELCSELLSLGVKLEPQSLNEQFKKESVAFLKKVFEQLLALKIVKDSQVNVLEKFSNIYIEDSSTVELPENLKGVYKGYGGGASSASIKFNLCQNLKDGDSRIELTAATVVDNTFRIPTVVKKALYLKDLGYFVLDEFERIQQQGAYFVSRYKYSVNVYKSDHPDDQAIDLQSIIDSMKENQYKELIVYLGKAKRFKTRLVLQKVPKAVADAKRKKMKTDKQNKRKSLTKQRLAFCDCNAYITNLEQEQWPAHLIQKLYKIRWQVEIIFKVWKSIFKLGNVHKMKSDRFLCLLYGHLTWIVLNMKIFSFFKAINWNERKVEISEWKGFNIICTYRDKLKEAITQNCPRLFEQFLDLCHFAIYNWATKQIRKGNPYPLFHIEKFTT